MVHRYKVHTCVPSFSLMGLQLTGLYENELRNGPTDAGDDETQFWQFQAFAAPFWATYGEFDPGAFVSLRKHGWIPAVYIYIYMVYIYIYIYTAPCTYMYLRCYESTS